MGRGSFASGPNLSGREIGAIALGSLVGMGALLIAGGLAHQIGFPLDDSWIHLTYARNLALTGEWVFRPGMSSAGSTSPVWTILLVPGFWLGLAPFLWSHMLGLVSLVTLGVTAEIGVRKLGEHYRPRWPWAGLLVCTEWHLLWASVSGMETLLHGVLLTIVLLMLLSGSRRYAAMGLLTALSIWVRPDGLTLAPVALLILGFSAPGSEERHQALSSYMFGLAALLVPYLLFNLWLAGTPFPNTFYAKQAEYVGWQSRPVVERLGSAVLQVSAGPAILLWPALGIQVFRAVKSHSLAVLAGLGWCIAYMSMYALRLPPYQHGRYLIPALPFLLMMAFVGMIHFRDMKWPGRRHLNLVRAWSAGLVLAQLGFLVLGARAYVEDVELIQTEMVSTARWVAANLAPAAVLAAHDIGALGYFDQHELIDLAGLVSPEVIPFIRDEDALAAYLQRRQATYLITFPDLYPHLVRDLKLVFASSGRIAPALGQGNMSVYCWDCP